MRVFFKLQNLFFDKNAVLKETDEGARKALSRFGAYTRQVAKNSLKYRKGPSAPGSPPHVHRSDHFSRKGKGGAAKQASPFKELIFFAYEPQEKTVIIGPIPFRGPVGVMPPLQEYGGTAPGRKNPRRRLRRLGGAGEVRIGGRPGRTSKLNKGGKLITYARLRTAAQVKRANHLNEILYGPAELAPAKYPPRPTMGPARDAAIQKLPSMWTNG